MFRISIEPTVDKLEAAVPTSCLAMSAPEETKKRQRACGKATPKNPPTKQMNTNNIGSVINEDYCVFVSDSLQCINQAYQDRFKDDLVA